MRSLLNFVHLLWCFIVHLLLLPAQFTDSSIVSNGSNMKAVDMKANDEWVNVMSSLCYMSSCGDIP